MEVANSQIKIDEPKLFAFANEAIIRTDYEKAKEHLSELIQAFPYKKKYYNILSFVYEQLGDLRMALKIRVGAASLPSTSYNDWKELLTECELNNEDILSEICCSKMIRIDPFNWEIVEKRLNLLLKTKQHNRLLDCFCELLTSHKSHAILDAGLSLCIDPSSEISVPFEAIRELFLENESCKNYEMNEQIANEGPLKFDNSSFDDYNTDALMNFTQMSDFEDDLDDLHKFGEFVKCDIEENDEKESDSEIPKEIKEFDINANFLEEKSMDFGTNNLEKFSVFKDSKNEGVTNLTLSLKSRKIKAMNLLEKYFKVPKNCMNAKQFSMDVQELQYVTLLSKLYVDLEEYSKAISFLSKIIPSDRCYLPQEVWVCEAVSLINLGYFDDIDQALERCSLLHNPNEEHCFSIGAAFLRKEKFSEAMKYLSPLKNSSEYQRPKFWYLYGYCAHLMEDSATAVEYLKKAISNDSECDIDSQLNARLCLSRIYSKSGNQKEALEALKFFTDLKHLNKQQAENKLLIRRGINVDPEAPEEFELASRLESGKKSKILDEYLTQKERLFINSKLELIAQQVLHFAREKNFQNCVSEISPAIGEILNGEIQPKRFLSHKRFVFACAVMAKLWSKPEFSVHRNKLLTLSSYCAWRLFNYKREIGPIEKTLSEIIFIGAKVFHGIGDTTGAYNCLRVIIHKFPERPDFINEFIKLVKEKNFDAKYTRVMYRFGRNNPQYELINILNGFSSMYKASYVMSIGCFIKAYNSTKSPILLLYISYCNASEHNKRSCNEKKGTMLKAIAFAKEYLRAMKKSAHARYNVALIYNLIGRKCKAVSEMGRVLLSKEFETKDHFPLDKIEMKSMKMFLEFSGGVVYDAAEKQLKIWNAL